jgi:hypothetical protein
LAEQLGEVTLAEAAGPRELRDAGRLMIQCAQILIDDVEVSMRSELSLGRQSSGSATGGIGRRCWNVTSVARSAMICARKSMAH